MNIRIFWAIIFISINAILLTACQQNSNDKIEVVATAFTAQATGTLVDEDGCIRLNRGVQSYGLLFPPDFIVTHQGESVFIVTGVVTHQPQEIRLRFGERVKISGGEQIALPPDFATTDCEGPYWVVGPQIERLSP